MGRGAISETDRIMAAPLAARGYAPPLGVYRLVVPGAGPFDLSAGAAPETEAIELSGPTGLRLAPRPSGTVSATTLGGAHFLGPVPLDPGGSPARGRSRIRIGAPVQGIDLSGLVSNLPAPGAAEPAPPTSRPSGPRPPQRAAANATRGLASKPSVAPAPGAGPAVSPARTVVTDAARPSGTVFTRSVVTGLPPGTYSWRHRDEAQAVGGVVLSGLSRPAHSQLPIALRFRYVGAPLWWSTGPRQASFESDTAVPSGAMVLGLQAANSAASIWRSILVASAGHDDVTGGMDSGRDSSADAMSSVIRKLDAPPAPVLVASPEQIGSASAPAYIAMSGSGRAGPISGAAAARARAQAVEMSIVAAIPPAPPPLESMSSAARGAEAPHARGRGSGDHVAQGQARDVDDVVSHSKIEGSVDAIAQRIYHRIRRRIQSDRERFGG